MDNYILDENSINSIVQKMIADKKQKQEICSSFIKSIKFHKIIREIIEKNIFIDNETFSYFPEKIMSQFNIENLTENDIDLFIDCLIDDELIISQNNFVEEENPFENFTDEKLGLRIFTMIGQGTCIQIFPAHVNRR